MGGYKVKGGQKLSGEIRIHGAKNAILPILASTVLNAGQSIIHNCPKISDVDIACKILESTGCHTCWDHDTLVVDTKDMDTFCVPEELVREVRSSIIFLGSILSRFRNVKISHPGGCELGERPIGLHLKALKDMGVEITEDNGFLICKADQLAGSKIVLDIPSVGATENIMLSAVYAKGDTIIANAAREPEIVDLQNFLNAMGANVQGAGSDTIVIEGSRKLHNYVEYYVMPDRIVAGTYLAAAAITGGDVLLKNVAPGHMEPILAKFSEAGCQIREGAAEIYLKAPNQILPVDFRTLPHPGFPTDMQPQMMSLLTMAHGTSMIVETMFESRFKHAAEMNRMGADITLEGRTAVVKGTDFLMGATVSSYDLRGGAALIVAGLKAEGESIILNRHYVERGYEKIEEGLKGLGADIKLVD